MPYTMDRIVEFWHLFGLHIRNGKKLCHAKDPPSDLALADVTETKTSMDALMDILDAGYRLEDAALIRATLACMRFRIVHGGVEAMECVDAVRRAYTVEVAFRDQAGVQKRILLTAALSQRSSLCFPGTVRDAFSKVLECQELRDDWDEAKRWQDRKS
ncbi:uncharacterized protein K460DRAFT_366435 [Cucurbitaria berberidis CBS 394.84]|uniref:Uncharacterized protein n=1 Tax=Cucurbitaria berberidis CBS 394.84 TaxID=1168544 RepID=A0A9P4L820_9PLEO|nr:uncharacterized protein K460DRAFT_366435 [Cucurbitaria berberidis CBS 394.84]KAF1845570.1 hypothetical protein K460DRAFT_366435 [Cucurbitaria berberidis CBS 394.84]